MTLYFAITEATNYSKEISHTDTIFYFFNEARKYIEKNHAMDSVTLTAYNSSTGYPVKDYKFYLGQY